MENDEKQVFPKVSEASGKYEEGRPHSRKENKTTHGGSMLEEGRPHSQRSIKMGTGQPDMMTMTMKLKRKIQNDKNVGLKTKGLYARIKSLKR